MPYAKFSRQPFQPGPPRTVAANESHKVRLIRNLGQGSDQGLDVLAIVQATSKEQPLRVSRQP